MDEFDDPSAAEAAKKRRQQLDWLASHPVPRKSDGGDGAGHARKRAEAKAPPRPAEEVDEQVDLHGLGVDEAMAKVEMALESAERAGLRKLRLVHGGSSSAPDSIRSTLLRRLNSVWKRRVKAHYPEPHNSGATIVVLPG